jgi:arylsulfatase A-like enzyme
VIIIIFIPSFIALLGLIYENRETKIRYREISSNTEKNVNIFLIVIDALRQDFLGCYGNKDRITPNLDKLAEEGILFKNCYAQGSWTKPSVASLLTSLYPPMHGANLHGDMIPDEVTTIA